MPLPDGIDSQATLDHLLRGLRHYALSPVGPLITKDLLELAEDGVVSMTVMPVDSLERQTAGVLAHMYKTLAKLLVEIAEEQGHAILDAGKWLEDADPDDLGGTPW